jgi:indole-3-glycerol phosphate synthase
LSAFSAEPRKEWHHCRTQTAVAIERNHQRECEPGSSVKGYEKGGAIGCFGAFTRPEIFRSNLADLKEATSLLSIPVLRKDFIVDEYQIHEAKAYGAAIIY